MNRLRPPLVSLISALAIGPWGVARAQDSAPLGEPIVGSINPAALDYDYLVDGNLAADDPGNRRFRTLQAAYAAAPAGTANAPTIIGIAPNVYLLPGTATGNSLDITKDYITLLGLTNNRRSVVLADNRGNQQQDTGTNVPNGNGYVIVVNADGFTAKNLTFLNYCNVDYEYPGDASKNLTKRSGVITQAVALQASGDKHVYENVALLSRLDTMFLRTTRSYFRDVFIEGTDDYIGGGTISVWENSEITFPTGSGVMLARNIAFINSTFRADNAMQFSKGAGTGVALINTVMPPASVPVAWVTDEAPPRSAQNYFTYRVTDAAGAPAVIRDGSSGPATFEYSYELTDAQALAFNPWNLLRATPTGAADDWDPAGARLGFEAAGQGSLIYKVDLTGSPASVRTGGGAATIGASVAPLRAADRSITWSTPSSAVTLSRTTGPDVVVTGNTTGEPEYVPIVATATNGLHGTAWVYVEPPYVDPPILARGPTLISPADGKIEVDYGYELGGRQDQSLITWSICADAECRSPRDVAVSRDAPLASYALTPGDIGKFIQVRVEPKHNVSDPGPAVFAVSDRAIEACDVSSSTVSPNFRNFVSTPNAATESGLWTVLGTWGVETDEAFVNGYGVRVGSQGASLSYQDDTPRGDMRVALTMTPEKTAGSGFGSPGSGADGNTIQKSDIYFKYDPRTQNGYSLRYWRTTESTSAVRFQLYRIENGVGAPLDDAQVLSGVFLPTTELSIEVVGDRVTVAAENDQDGTTLSMEGTITPNDFGGAGVAWYGTVPRGNSNVYSRFEISYPGAADICPGRPTPAAETDDIDLGVGVDVPSDTASGGPSGSSSGNPGATSDLPPGSSSDAVSALDPGSASPVAAASRSRGGCSMRGRPRHEGLLGLLMLLGLLRARRSDRTKRSGGNPTLDSSS